MGNRIHELGIDLLPVGERIALAQDIWDSVLRDSAPLPVGAQAKMELEHRLTEDDASPDAVVDWEIIKQEARVRWRG